MSRALTAARGALGVRFRLHGRDSKGLDCVGLALLALRAEGFEGAVPSGYALRSGDLARVRAEIEAWGLVEAEEAQPGDLLLVRAGPGQLHFAIQTETGVIHADALLRRVVERPDMPWPVLGRWRLTTGERHGDGGADGRWQPDRRAGGRSDRRDDRQRDRPGSAVQAQGA